jgi:hypothetical protein
MGLWNYKMITILLEGIIFFAAFIFMQKARKPSIPGLPGIINHDRLFGSGVDLVDAGNRMGQTK